ncbi:putative beta-lysine N-acetyltransferase [Bacteroidota bacterium]
MYDKIEKIGKSLIQHGKYNDRIYLMKLHEEDYPQILDLLEKMTKENKYSKIFAKVQESFVTDFLNQGFTIEAKVSGFFDNTIDGLFLAKYYSEERRFVTKIDNDEIENNIRIAKAKAGSKKVNPLDPNFYIKKLDAKDLGQLAKLYKIVFPTYPFPIHETNFLIEVMNDNVEFYGVISKKDGNLIAASSAEKYDEYSNVEMTDFATHPDFPARGLALHLLDGMEEEMLKQGFKTLYTIARSHSAGMNITFAKNDYIFAGTLINNTNISGRIESMNVWYKTV